MFIVALLIGIYGYAMFFLGILGLLEKTIIASLTVLFFFLVVYINWKNLIAFFSETRSLLVNKVHILFISILLLQAVVNVIGALGPELAFDSLWYHLTLPKLYILHHTLWHIPGGLLYYSDMPKLTEMLYIGALLIHSEVLVKLIHFSFGILTVVALYKLSRKFFVQKISFLIILVFYANLVVAWESITAYVDLTRAFFEVLALWAFIDWYTLKKSKWLVLCAVMLGFAISVKVLAMGSLAIIIVLLFLFNRSTLKLKIATLLTVTIISLSIVLPWFIFSYHHTHNPIYPFFTNLYHVPISFDLFSPKVFIATCWIFFTHLSDPISPVYLICLPLIVIYFSALKPVLKIVVAYCMCAFFIWYITPQTGGGRFILPYLPAFSLLVGAVIEKIEKKKIGILIFIVIIFVSVTSILYRALANAKYLPVIFGQETKKEFLSSHLNFSFGDFYDIDDYFARHITPTDRVLLYNFHNLYYINFPFIHESWIKKGDTFNYIAVQNGTLPKRFDAWQRVYANNKTHVALYTLNRTWYTY